MKLLPPHRTSRRVAAYLAVLCLSIASFTAAALDPRGGAPGMGKDAIEAECKCKVVQDLDYKTTAGADPRFSTIDIYYRETDTPKPVLLFIHGGGWMSGDKANISTNPKLLKSFLDAGYVVASPNFRLVEKNPRSRITYREMATDIAQSIKWLHDNVGQYGGTPDSFVLVGYSSGAHLVALVATDERYLEQQGLDNGVIRAVSAWDVPAYDVPLALTLMEGTQLEPKIRFNQALFGHTREDQLQASPVNYLDSDGSHIRFQLISAGKMHRQSQTISKRASESFKDALAEAGHQAKHHHYSSMDHAELPMNYGKGGAKDISRQVENFLSDVN